MNNKQMSCDLKENIFKDYGWSKPDIKGQKINLENNQAAFTWNGKSYTLQRDQEQLILKEASGTTISGQKKRSSGDMYFDKSSLKLKPVQRSRWVSHQTTQMQTVMVTKTRPVTRYQYDYSSKTSRPVYSTESYMATEYRLVPKTEWKWEFYTDYEIDIPAYDYHTFTMPNGTHLVIYEANPGLVLQNISYYSAIDEQGINHVLLDADNNGSFLDQSDRIMFNSWNPYAKESNYRPVRFFRENSWYDLAYLKNENFLTIGLSNNTLSLQYENDAYAQSKEKGRVTFSDIPEKATLIINGQAFRSRSSDKTFKSEYGIFKARIQQKGYLDHEVTYTVNKDNPNPVIKYQPTAAAALLEIRNIFLPNYFVLVTNDKGYSRTYYNTSSLSVPTGNNQIQIYSEGFTFPYAFTARAEESTSLDFEAEIKKLKSPENAGNKKD